jgi:hypothetical protein
MISRKLLSRLLVVFISLAPANAPLVAQQKTPQEKTSPGAPAKPPTTALAAKPAIAIDTLLAADTYKVYGEVKSVGTLVSTGSIAELIDPIMKLADPPKEFKTLVKFINNNAEALADARLCFAAWPARPGVPNAFFVIELATAEDAEKFEPKLNRVLPTILPTPTPTPAEQPAKSKADAVTTGDPAVQPSAQKGQAESQETPKPAPPPFVVSRSGNLVFVTDKPFKFEKLRPADSKLLTEDQNFRQAHERFSTEPVFIYFNVALQDMNRAQPTPEPTVDVAEQARISAEQEAETIKAAAENGEQVQEQPQENPPAPEPEPTVQQTAVLSATVVAAPSPTPPQVSMIAVSSILGLLGGGQPEWPDAVGVALTQEADDYVIRSILIGPANSKRLVLPFVPQLLAGRSFAPNAPSILPDDTEILVSASFDLPKTYQEMLVRLEASNKGRVEQVRKVPAAHRSEDDEKPYDPFLDFEKKGGFKIKEDLLPAFGNEIAIAGSIKSLQGSGVMGIGMAVPSTRPPADEKDKEAMQAQKKREDESTPVVLISVRDREAARRLMPKVLDGLGIGMANMLGSTVKRDDTEMVDFAGAFAYAFVGDFLVISTSPAVRHLIDSRVNHQTLASNPAYRNFTRWQPAGIIGGIYVSPVLMDSYTKAAHDPAQSIAPAMREYLLRLNPTPQAISYALSNDGAGSLHELHLPKAFVLASVAGAASATKEPPPEMNESIAMSLLRMVANAENTYKAGEGKGSYASLDKLIALKLIPREPLDKYGYRFDVNASGAQFEATATPVEYGKTGRISYFIDATLVLRGGDHGGGQASLSDKPMQ